MPTVISNPVPTSQRPFNGAVSGGLALATMAILTGQGISPDYASFAGMAASGIAATLGDWSRGLLEEGVTNPAAKLFLMLFARIG